MPYHAQPRTLGARRNWTSYGQNDNIDMGHWAEDQSLGLPQSGNNNDAWLSGLGGMPSQLPGYGASSNMGDAYRNLSIGNPNRYMAHPMENETVPSFYSDSTGGGSNIADKLRGMNLGAGGNWQFGAGRLGADAPWRQDLAAKGTSWLDSLGGWGGIANLGMTGWGLLQNREKMSDLKDYRADLTTSRKESAALDKEKFGLVKEEYGDRKKIRKANIYSQRPQDAATNPYINEIIQPS